MIELISSVVTLVYAVTLMCMLLDLEIKGKSTIYSVVVFVLMVFIFNGYILINFGYKTFMNLYPILIHVPLFITFLFISRYKGIKLFFVLLTVIVLSSPPILLGLIAASFFNYNEMILTTVCLVMYIAVIFIVYKYFRPLLLYMLRNTQKGWCAFCSIPLCYSALIYFPGKYNVANIRAQATFLLDAISAIFVLCAYGIILHSFKQTREQLIMQNEQDVFKTQVSAAQAHFEALKESEEKAIIYRHDFHHHLQLINSYLNSGNIGEAKKYISDIENNIDNTVIEKYCDNHIVNLILSSYINKAKAKKIIVETNINVSRKNAVADMDLCVILANTLENAINACKSIPNTELRKIIIICREKQNKLFIQITNSFMGEVEFVDNIPQSQHKHHGFGTKSIASIVEKYHGTYSFTAENSVFKVSVII